MKIIYLGSFAVCVKATVLYIMNIVNIILLSYLILGAMSMVSKEHPQIKLHLCPKVIIFCQ